MLKEKDSNTLGVHARLPALELLPAGHARQTVLFSAVPASAWNVLAAHVDQGMQALAPATAYVPAAQGAHAVLPAAANVPGAHSPQTVLLEAVQALVGAWPAAQIAQAVHWEEAVLSAKKPAAHAVQGPVEAAAA
jgi:hypothetical protein